MPAHVNKDTFINCTYTTAGGQEHHFTAKAIVEAVERLDALPDRQIPKRLRVGWRRWLCLKSLFQAEKAKPQEPGFPSLPRFSGIPIELDWSLDPDAYKFDY